VHYPILVVVPNIMSIIDAYAMVKATFNNYRRPYYYAIVNMVKHKEDYKKTINVLRKSLKTYHNNLELEGLGYIPYSEKLEQGELPKRIYDYVDEILINLFKDIGFIKEEKKGFWKKLKSFFTR
jgi:MinD-like ATPase involved in chromosome partitioning or flagellar assembly